MPCTGGCNSPEVPAPSSALRDISDAYNKLMSDFNRLKRENDQTTRLLCEVMAAAEDKSEPFSISDYTEKSELIVWWNRHKKLDSDRREKAKLKAGIKKLQKKLESLDK